ncbi:hypothetical protein ACFL4I_01200, partial [Pseudomonadota bacterium]
MKVVSLFTCGYCRWFFVFYQKVVRPHNGVLYFYGAIGAVRDFSNIVSFFIPLKLVMVLSNPDILKLQFFSLNNINLEEFMYYSAFLFFVLMVISFVCHIFLKYFVHRKAESSWGIKKDEFPDRLKYQNLYQSMVDTITHLFIIVVG